MSKEVRQLIRAIERQGWTVEKGSKHFKAKSPDGETIVTIPTTPGGGRWRQNVVSQLKRGGFKP